MLETKTTRGVVKAKCRRCEKWKTLDGEAWYFKFDAAGNLEAKPYVTICKDCEKTKSRDSHLKTRARRASEKIAAETKVVATPRKRTSAKSTTAKRSTSKRSTAKRSRAKANA